MRRAFIIMFVLVVSVSLIGCKKKPRQDIAEVPPPSGSQTPSAQSIYVGPPALTNGVDLYVPPESSDTYVGGSSSTTPSIYTSPAATTPLPSTPLYTSPPVVTPSAVDSPPTYTIPIPDAGGSSYTVRHGDTLWSIAVRVYGSGKRWPAIANANNIGNERKLRIGQKLIIP